MHDKQKHMYNYLLEASECKTHKTTCHISGSLVPGDLDVGRKMTPDLSRLFQQGPCQRFSEPRLGVGLILLKRTKEANEAVETASRSEKAEGSQQSKILLRC